eukprot:5243805-Alexandrium_andersonii.AAC.1
MTIWRTRCHASAHAPKNSLPYKCRLAGVHSEDEVLRERVAQWQKRTQLCTWFRATPDRKRAFREAMGCDGPQPGDAFWGIISEMATLAGGPKGK